MLYKHKDFKANHWVSLWLQKTCTIGSRWFCYYFAIFKTVNTVSLSILYPIMHIFYRMNCNNSVWFIHIFNITCRKIQ